MLPIVLGMLLGGIALFIYSLVAGFNSVGYPYWGLFIFALLLEIVSIVMLVGFFALQPNEARVLVLFGAYRGTVRDSGFHWANPFYSNGPAQASTLVRMAEMQSNVAAGKSGSVAPPRKTPGRFKISLRARNLNGEKLKVND